MANGATREALDNRPELFGLVVFSHGWARFLTVMSPQGVAAVLNAVGQPEDIGVEWREGQLPRLRELRDGALDRLIETHGILVLSKDQWEARKSEFGASIYE